MKPATLDQVFQLLKSVRDQNLGSSHVQALIETGRFADICEAAKKGSLTCTDRTRFRNCLGLDAVDCGAYDVVVDYSRSLAQMIRGGNYDSFNSDITPKHFPVSGRGRHEVSVVLLRFNREMKPDEVITEMDQQDYRPAAIEELLALGEAYPNLQRKFLIVALGSILRTSNGNRCAPCLSGRMNERRLNFFWLENVWFSNYRSLAVRK